jgi:hypothetical protein
MYTLYGKKGSGSASTQAALDIIGAPYRIVETASWATNEAFADLLKINPLGQIPTLVLPDGTVLSESAAILIHLGEAHPQSGLLPRDASARAQAIRGSSSSRPIAMPPSASSISRSASARMPTKRPRSAFAPARALACISTGTCSPISSPPVPGWRRNARRTRSLCRCRIQMVGIPGAPREGAAGIPPASAAHRSSAQGRTGVRQHWGK